MDLVFPLQQFQAFIFVFFRVSGLIFFAPLLSSRAIPPQVKITIALGAAVLFFPAVSQPGMIIPDDPVHLTLAIMGELLIGMSIGVVAQVIASAVQFAGHTLGFHMGFRLANVYDPSSELTVSMVGAFMNLVTVLILLGFNFHIIMFKVVRESYRSIRPLGMSFSMEAGEVILRVGADVFLFGVQVAAPVLAAMFFIELTIAVLAKTAKQFNLLMLQFPIKILIGLFFFTLLMKVMPRAVEVMLKSVLERIGTILSLLG